MPAVCGDGLVDSDRVVPRRASGSVRLDGPELCITCDHLRWCQRLAVMNKLAFPRRETHATGGKKPSQLELDLALSVSGAVLRVADLSIDVDDHAVGTTRSIRSCWRVRLPEVDVKGLPPRLGQSVTAAFITPRAEVSLSCPSCRDGALALIGVVEMALVAHRADVTIVADRTRAVGHAEVVLRDVCAYQQNQEFLRVTSSNITMLLSSEGDGGANGIEGEIDNFEAQWSTELQLQAWLVSRCLTRAISVATSLAQPPRPPNERRRRSQKALTGVVHNCRVNAVLSASHSAAFVWSGARLCMTPSLESPPRVEVGTETFAVHLNQHAKPSVLVKGLDIRHACVVASSHRTMQTALTAQEVRLHVLPQQSVGQVLHTALAQQSALNAAMRAVTVSQQHAWGVVGGAARSTYAPRFATTMALNSCKIVLDHEAVSGDAPMLQADATGISAKLCNMPTDSLKETVQRLDSDSSPHSWGKVLGGDLSVDAKLVTVGLSGNHFFTCEAGSTRGILIAASLATIPKHITRRKVSLMTLPAGEASVIVAEAQSDGMPQKVYMTLQLHGHRVVVNHGPFVQRTVPLLQAVITRVIPSSGEPAPKPVGAPLAWWDMLRMMVHGAVVLSADDFELFHQLREHDQAQRSTAPLMRISGRSIKAQCSCRSLKLSGCDVFLSVPRELPPGSDDDPNCDDDDNESTGSDHSVRRPVSERRQRLVALPNIVMSAGLTWDCADPFGHHVQLLNVDGAKADIFRLFRSRGLKLDIDIGIADTPKDSEDRSCTVMPSWLVLPFDLLPWLTNGSKPKQVVAPVKRSQPCFPVNMAISARMQHLRVAVWPNVAQPATLMSSAGHTEGIAVRAEEFELQHEINLGNAPAVAYGTRVVCSRMQVAAIDFGPCCAVSDSGSSDMFVQLAALQDGVVSTAVILCSDKIEIRRGACAAAAAHEDAAAAAANARTVAESQSTYFRPSLFTFSLNHNRLRPASYTTRKLSEDEVEPRATRAAASQTPSRETPSNAAHRQTGTHGAGSLRVTIYEAKLLWTLDIRDAVLDFILHSRAAAARMRQASGKPGEVAVDLGEIDTPSSTQTDHGAVLSVPETPTRASTVTSSGEAAMLQLLGGNRGPSNMETHSAGKHRSMLLAMDMARKKLSPRHPSRPSSDEHPKDPQSPGTAEQPAAPSENDFSLLFEIRLVNFQLNLLCEKTSGSVVVSAAEAYMEGRRYLMPVRALPSIASNQVLQKHEVRVRLENTATFVVPTDIDVNARVQWLNMSSSSPARGLLRRVVQDFGLAFSYIYYRPMPAGGQVVARPATQELVDYCLLDVLDELSFTLDSREFDIMQDVIRNVLLAAPYERQEAEHGAQARKRTSRRHLVARLPGKSPSHVVDMNVKADREGVKSAIEDAIAKLIDSTPRVVKRIEYTITKGSWTVRALADEATTRSATRLDEVELGFSGLHGLHEFRDDASMLSTFEIENLYVTNQRPGPQSMAFTDPSIIIRPKTMTRQPCQRCGCHFAPERNGPRACRFHADESGDPGKFVVSGTDLSRSSGRWTCCGATWEGAPGCSSRSHISKEVMLSVHARSSRPICIGGVEVNVYEHIEIRSARHAAREVVWAIPTSDGFRCCSMFPGVEYTLNIQLTKDIANLFFAYFFAAEAERDASSSALLYGKFITRAEVLLSF